MKKKKKDEARKSSGERSEVTKGSRVFYCDWNEDCYKKISCDRQDDGYEKIRTMKLIDLIEWLLESRGSVGGKSSSLSITSNMVWLKGRILENVMASAARLGARKMSIKIDGDDIKISLPLEADNIAMSNGIFENRITGCGLYPYADNVKVRRSKSNKSVTVSISTRKCVKGSANGNDGRAAK